MTHGQMPDGHACPCCRGALGITKKHRPHVEQPNSVATPGALPAPFRQGYPSPGAVSRTSIACGTDSNGHGKFLGPFWAVLPIVAPFYPFLGEGSPTKIDYSKKGTLILTSTGGPGMATIGSFSWDGH